MQYSLHGKGENDMDGLISEIVFHYGKKGLPADVKDAQERLEALLRMDEMDVKTNDIHTAAILDYYESAVAYGFALGLTFARDLDKELTRYVYKKVMRSLKS